MTSERTVKVFLSSTFRDMHAERDHLVTVVFLELRDRLEKLGLELYDVDLRWGVPERGADGEKANPWAYCKKWIDRVDPFFVCLLGQRYGYVPKPEDVPDLADRHEFAQQSITEMEVRYAVLKKPVSNRVRRSFFYLRETRVPIAGTTPEAYNTFVEQGREAELERLTEAVEKSGRPVRRYHCRWTGTGFDELDELGRMILEDLWSGVLRDERYVSAAAWEKVAAELKIKDVLKLRQTEQETVPREIWERIMEHTKPLRRSPLENERGQMTAFGETRVRWFVGRTKELGELAHFVNTSGDQRLCVVRAMPGQGKSALLAKFSQLLGQDGRRVVVTHFVGATERSADARSLVERILDELDASGIPWRDGKTTRRDLQALSTRLTKRLQNYNGDREIVLLIDAVNQLSDGRDLGWLPTQLGPQVRIMLSCVESDFPTESEAQVLAALTIRKPCWVKLPPLTPENIRTIVVEYLAEYCHELDAESVQQIVTMPAAANPLYLLVMLRELRTLGGDDMNLRVPQLIAQMQHLYPDSVRLFEWVLERLEVFGPEAVRRWCTYLRLGRTGMSSRELAELLRRKLGEGQDHVALRIERGLRPYLQRRGEQLDFLHGQLGTAAARRYAIDDESAWHWDVAAYMEKRWKEPNEHAISELPYHQTRARAWDALQATLTSLRFVHCKCVAGLPYGLVDDYRAAREAWPAVGDANENTNRSLLPRRTVPRDVRLFGQFVSCYAHIFARDPEQVIAFGHNYASSGPVAEAADRELAEGKYNAPWIKLLDRPALIERPALLRSFEAHPAPITGVASSRDFRIAVSADESGVIRSWELASGRLLREFQAPNGSGIVSLTLAKDALTLAAVTEEGTCYFWPSANETRCECIETSNAAATAVSITPDGETLAIGTASGHVYRWSNTHSQLTGHSQDGHRGAVTAIAISENSSLIVSGGADEEVRLWDGQLGSPRLRAVVKGTLFEIRSVAVNGQGIVIMSSEGQPPGNYTDYDNARGITEPATVKVIGPAGQVLASDKPHNIVIQRAEGHFAFGLQGGAIYSVAVTPNGSHGVSVGYDGKIVFWDLHAPRVVGSLQTNHGSLWSATLDDRAEVVLSGGEDGTMRLWDRWGRCEPGPHYTKTKLLGMIPWLTRVRPRATLRGGRGMKCSWDEKASLLWHNPKVRNWIIVPAMGLVFAVATLPVSGRLPGWRGWILQLISAAWMIALLRCLSWAARTMRYVWAIGLMRSLGEGRIYGFTPLFLLCPFFHVRNCGSCGRRMCGRRRWFHCPTCELMT